MKILFIILLLSLVSTVGYAGEYDNEKKEVYDNQMKSAGKWEFIGNTFLFTAVLGLGASYYSLDKVSNYTDKEGEPREDLTDEEFAEYAKYDQIMRTSLSITAGSFLVGIIGHGVSASYERDANGHALKVGIDF